MPDYKFGEKHRAIVYSAPVDTVTPKQIYQELDLANSKWTTKQIISAILVVLPMASGGYVAWASLKSTVGNLQTVQIGIVDKLNKVENAVISNRDEVRELEKKVLVENAQTKSRLDSLERRNS